MAVGMRVPAVVDDGRGSDARAVLVPHVPRLAAEWAASAPEDRWRVLDASLVFADVSGFTALSERLARQGPAGAEELTDVLGRCFEELLAAAYARGGSLVKFGGDALLLLFDGDDHAPRAVDAAQELRTTMRQVGRLRTSVGDVRLRMSLGVHTGEIHAFLVGSSHRELLLAGPGVSAVVRMEGAASAGEIVLSAAGGAVVEPARLGAAKGPGVLLRDRRLVDDDALTAAPDRPPVELEAIEGCVPTVLRSLLLDGGGESEHRHASIAFVHFDGVDERLAAHGAAWVASALEELVRDVQDAAATHEVTLLASDIDHDGGKLILVSGVPRTFGDDDGRLLRAVDEIRRRRRGIPIRIGVNSGPVFAGAVGPAYRRTFTIMGDAVNLAARLMAKAGGGEVIASLPVLRSSRSQFASTPLEPFYVKGKRRPIAAAVVGPLVGTQETRVRRHLPFVGRDQELDLLVAGWRRVRGGTGSGVGVVVSGEVGAGKTRLVEELRSVVTGDGGEVRVVQCEPYETSTPYFAARLLLRAALGDDPDVAAVVGAVAPDLADWAPLVADVLGVRVRETVKTRHLGPEFRRARTLEVVAELLGRLLTVPTALVFEDVHWMDDASRRVLERLLADAPKRPWVVVATTRTAGSFDAAVEVPLGPLLEDATRALVRAATVGAPLRPERFHALCERSGGVPLYVEELLALGEDDPLPESLEAVVTAQVDALAPAARRALLVASVLGTSFDRTLLAAVGGRDAEHRLPDEHVVVELDGRLRFRHRLVRDVAYDLLPYATRRDLHGLAADALPPERDALRSLHCQHAGRHAEAFQLAKTAAKDAQRRLAFVEARTLLERAIASARRLPEVRPRALSALWEQLGNVGLLTNDLAAADAAFGAVRRLLPDDALVQAAMAYRHSDVAERAGRNAAATYWVGRGLAALDPTPQSRRVDVERAQLLVRRAALDLQRGRIGRAKRWTRRALLLAESAPAGARASAFAMLDLVHIAEGRLDLATNGARAAALYRRARQWDSLARLENNLGALAYYRGDWSEALARYESARSGFEKVGSTVDAALGASNIAEIFADQGRLDEAEAILREVIEVWRSVSFPLGVARATRYLARVELRRGKAAEALAMFDSARPTFEASGLVGNVHEIDVWAAECRLRLGDLAGSIVLLERCQAFERSAGPTELAPMLHRLLAAAAAAEGRIVDAWAEVDEALHLARSRGAGFEIALALEAMAAIAELGGPALDAAAIAERDELLRSLGVRRPPLALAAVPVA